MEMSEIEQIKCGTCKQINYVNPKIIHAEGDPLQLHCTYCKADIESKIVLYDKVVITTNTAFLMNQIFNRAGTVEGDTLDQKLFKWVKRQHDKSWSNYGKKIKNTKDFVKVTFELVEG